MNKKVARQIQKYARLEVIANFRNAVDQSYRRIRGAARRQWEHHFLHRFDPADACVTVRINDVPVRAIRGSGFLKSGKIATRQPLRSPHFAH